MALAARHACTIEAWVSADTLAPPSHWTGCLLSWETAAGQQNFSILHQFLAGRDFFTALIVLPYGTNLTMPANPHPLRLNGFRSGLRHLVITWDGRLTTATRTAPG